MRKTLAILFALAPATAFAHEGLHEHTNMAQALDHLLTQPDHQITLAGLVVAIVTGGWFWVRANASK